MSDRQNDDWLNDLIRTAHAHQLGALFERVEALVNVMNEDLDEEVTVRDMLNWLAVLGYTLVPSDENVASLTYHAELVSGFITNGAR